MKRLFAAVSILVLLGFVGVDYSRASRPVPRTITGCVIGGQLYSIHKGVSEATGKRSPMVYPISVQDLDLRPYEGKTIQIQGNLLPGDRFFAFPETLRVLGPCDKESKRTIREQTR
jgi:hypothetical protein